MAVAAQLFELEQLDAELERRRATIAEIQRRLQQDPAIAEHERRLEQARADESSALLEQRRLEGELADLETRLRRDHERLYGGHIVDPREIASLEKELEHYRSRCSELEEQVLAAMERSEAAQHDASTLSRELDELRRQRTTDVPDLRRQGQGLVQEMTELRRRREEMLAALDARTIDAYTRLRRSSGHAVSHVSNGVCQWCRVVIPPKDIQHARSGQLVTCSNCARILFVG